MRRFAPHVLALIVFASPLLVHSALGQNNDWRPTGDQRYGAISEELLSEQQQSSNANSDRSITPLAPTGGARGLATGSHAGNLAPIRTAPQRAQFTEKSNTLPRSHGQIFREYDIRPYTLRSTASQRPEQIIVDWILRETGYEAWHTEPLGLLSATRETLTVYHTPEMHAVVADIVDRFVNSQAAQSAFSLRIATIRSPNWRAKALPLMTPIPVQTPGVQGWLLAKEDAALLLSMAVRRTDFREYTSSDQLIASGQSIVVSTMRPRPYIKGIVPTGAAWPGYQPEMGQLEEGFTLEFSPLLSLDLASADAVIKLRLHQVEKMVPVKLDMPTAVAPTQRVEVEVPQMTTANIHERFHWPTDKVLLLSMGVVATPDQGGGNPLTDAMPIFKSPPRADALLMVECRSSLTPAVTTPAAARSATLQQRSYLGRY